MPGRLVPALVALLLAGPGPAEVASPPHAPADQGSFSALEPGLELGQFTGPGGVPGDGRIWVVRIDPARFELKLLNASSLDSRPRTLRGWVQGASAVAGINASMFQTDGLTSVGLMRTRSHQNNPRRAARYKAVLAFDPLRAGDPPVRILDAACGELDPLTAAYGTLIQSIRMVSCDGKNVWAPDARRWSTAAIGLDGAGRTLFIHARSAWPVHDLVDRLLQLPLDVRRALYVEGGPEAQLYVRSGAREVERLGAFEGQRDETGLAWEVPNAVVAVRRAR